jgi:heterodisulfide reductase subunit C
MRRGTLMGNAFETALNERVDAMLDACTKCGKCVEACPITGPAGVADADPVQVISGVLDILRTGEGPDEARKWASACVLSGECIKACDYGVNPRFLLTMARLAIMRNDKDPTERRKAGVMQFRKVGEDTSVLSRLQLSEESLIRLGQRPSKQPTSDELPDVVFYTGCNVLKTPHIALLCLDIMDTIGTDYQVMGGPTHCCGTSQLRAGDIDTLGRFANNTIHQNVAEQVLSVSVRTVLDGRMAQRVAPGVHFKVRRVELERVALCFLGMAQRGVGVHEQGIDVVGITKRGQGGKEAFAMTFEQGLELALEVGREAARLAPDAEAILVPGGATMSLHVIPAIEEEFGKPTFTRTSAEVWRNLVHPGIIPPVTGWGQLLASCKQSEQSARSAT